METSLHRQLKAVYAPGEAHQEVPLEGYRIDAVADGELIEIQHGSLAAIRDKISTLLARHRVRVVKPLVLRRRLLKRAAPGAPISSSRLSPKQGTLLDLFHELVYFTRVFPHPNLLLEVPLVEIEEIRVPGHGRRRRWRKNDFQVEDQRLVAIEAVHRFARGADLLGLLPPELPRPFDTGELAAGLGVSRWVAQRVAYCLREMGAARAVGKRGNAHVYELIPRRARRRRSA